MLTAVVLVAFFSHTIQDRQNVVWNITAASYTEDLSVSLCKADHTARQKTHMTAVNKVQERRRGDAVRKCQSNQ